MAAVAAIDERVPSLSPLTVSSDNHHTIIAAIPTNNDEKRIAAIATVVTTADPSVVTTKKPSANDDESSDEEGESHRPPPVTCIVCGAVRAIYKCPKCDRRSCSLACVRRHKADNSCDGLQGRSTFAPLPDITEKTILNGIISLITYTTRSQAYDMISVW